MLRDTIVNPSQAQQFTQDSNGILLFYDNSRSKYLSTSRQILSFGINHRNIAASQWMMATSRVRTNIIGYKIPRNATITALTIQSQNSVANCSFNIRKNNSVTNIVSVTLVGQTSNVTDNLNVDIDINDWLQVFLQVNSGNVDNPLLNLEIAWR